MLTNSIRHPHHTAIIIVSKTKMPLKLALLEEEDISAFVQVDDAAMKDWGLAKAMEKSNHSGKPRIKLIEGYMRAGFEQNSECVFLKVTDTDTGKLIAGGQWTFNFEGKKEETTEQAPASKVMQNATDVTAEMSRMGKEFMKEFVGSKPYASMLAMFDSATLFALPSSPTNGLM